MSEHLHIHRPLAAAPKNTNVQASRSFPPTAAVLQRRALHEKILQKKEADRAEQLGRAKAAREARTNLGGLPPNIQAKMEGAFGADFSSVNIHQNSFQATELGALAYTQGEDIHFAPGQFDASSHQGQSLIGHELAHVVQQRAGRVQATTQLKGTSAGLNAGVGINDDKALEREADLMGEKAARGERNRVSLVGSQHLQSQNEPFDAVDAQRSEPLQQLSHDLSSVFATHVIQAKVDTSGGTWDTTTYNVQDFKDAGTHYVGAEINLEFEPNALVEADDIGITQSVKTLQSTAADKTHATEVSTVSARKASISLTAAEGDLGRAIDQGDNSVIPNTNPLYAVENTAADVSASLDDLKPVAANGFGEHASRKNVEGKFVTKKGWIYDGPKRIVKFAGQQFDQTFEVTALVLNGPLANSYLGSVEWGWSSDATETPTLKPLKIVRSGAPSEAFMKAANKWNDAQFDDGEKKYDTVNLPLTTIQSGEKEIVGMTDDELIGRYKVVVSELAKVDGVKSPNDFTNLQFEKSALEADAVKRKVALE